jgi:hypothetical protein
MKRDALLLHEPVTWPHASTHAGQSASPRHRTTRLVLCGLMAFAAALAFILASPADELTDGTWWPEGTLSVSAVPR